MYTHVGLAAGVQAWANRSVGVVYAHLLLGCRGCIGVGLQVAAWGIQLWGYRWLCRHAGVPPYVRTHFGTPSCTSVKSIFHTCTPACLRSHL